MFSTMTIVSSITRPMAMARPPIDIRLMVPPARPRMKNVPTIVSGSEVAAMKVTRQSRRNRMRTRTARKPPMRIASRMLATEARTNAARS
jgi:hypothetical protein